MEQRPNDIQRGIESTRATVDNKLDTLAAQARDSFDLQHQVAERPWLMLGAAVAAGYVLGSMGGAEEQRWSGTPAITTNYNQHAYMPDRTSSAAGQASRSSAGSFLSQFDDEIDMLKTAAIATLTTFLRDKVKEYVPALGEQLGQQMQGQRSKTPSTAPGASRYANPSGAPAVNTESIPTTTSYGSNMVDRGAEHASPYYPPGSAGTGADRDYVKTYHPPSETERERSVGEDPTGH
jgi:hypothetical protein